MDLSKFTHYQVVNGLVQIYKLPGSQMDLFKLTHYLVVNGLGQIYTLPGSKWTCPNLHITW